MCRQEDRVLQLLWERLESFTKALGIAINKDKTFIFTTDDALRRGWEAGPTVANLKVQEMFVYLGVLVDTRSRRQVRVVEHPVGLQKTQSLADKSLARVKRIRALPLSIAQRGALLGAAVTAGLCSLGLEAGAKGAAILQYHRCSCCSRP